MTTKMKSKFDKYSGECNLLMAFGAIMDPRMKFVVIEYAFPMIYEGDKTILNISYVRNLVVLEVPKNVVGISTVVGKILQLIFHKKTNKKLVKSDLDKYLEDGLEICPTRCPFDVIAWWKSNQMKYRNLSRMDVDIIAIPISTVAAESTFNAGERVVDTYCSKLGIETVQALICSSNWIRSQYNLKGRMKEEEDGEEIEITLPTS